MNNNSSSLCLIGEQLANNTGLLIILGIKIVLSTIGFILIVKLTLFRYKNVAYSHPNLKILLYFIHYFGVYLLCLTNIIPHTYSLIKFILFNNSINNNDPCLMVEKYLEMSDSTCLIIRSTTLFAIYLLAISLMTIVIERTIATFQFRTYETCGNRFAIIGVLLAV